MTNQYNHGSYIIHGSFWWVIQYYRWVMYGPCVGQPGVMYVMYMGHRSYWSYMSLTGHTWVMYGSCTGQSHGSCMGQQYGSLWVIYIGQPCDLGQVNTRTSDRPGVAYMMNFHWLNSGEYFVFMPSWLRSKHFRTLWVIFTFVILEVTPGQPRSKVIAGSGTVDGARSYLMLRSHTA